jgi:hypothetical protein
MTEDEAKRFPIGSTVRIANYLNDHHGKQAVVLHHQKRVGGPRSWIVVLDNGTTWSHRDSLEIVNPGTAQQSDVDKWFDEQLTKKPETQKEWQPDKEIDWESHKGFMRGL